MELGLAGKTVVVTGGASHLGRSIVLAFAAEGSDVVVADIDETQAQKTADLARRQGDRILVIKTDVTSPEQCEAMTKKTLDKMGRLDVLVNNAGGAMKLQPFAEQPTENAAKEMDINYWGVFNSTRAVIDHMIAQKTGKIVNMASDAGKIGQNKQASYSAAKGAIIALTKSLALEFGRYGINVNAVCPGAVLPDTAQEVGKGSMWREGAMFDEWTPQIREQTVKKYPLRRLGRPEDVANLVLFLASDAASWITGQAISVDGGVVMV